MANPEPVLKKTPVWEKRGRAVPAMLLGLLGCTLALGGCSPGTGPAQVELGSRIFRAVKIIGSRGTMSGQFNKPRSVAVDQQDNLYVVDITGRVQKFSPEGLFLTSWQMPQTDLGKAKGMALDKDGQIIILEPHYSRVNHFAPEGRLVKQWGQHGVAPGDLAFPRSVAVNAKGEMFVSEYGVTERIQHFTAEGKLLGVLGKAGAGPGEFNRAEGICLDSQDRLYVADSCNHRIQVFDAAGKFLRSYGCAGTGPGEMSYPYDIRVDGAGHQFVCEFGNSRVQVFDAQDRLVEVLGKAGSAPGEFNNPWTIALDSRGNLYVADSQNHRVQKFLRR